MRHDVGLHEFHIAVVEPGAENERLFPKVVEARDKAEDGAVKLLRERRILRLRRFSL